MGCWDHEGNQSYYSPLDTIESITIVALAVGKSGITDEGRTLVYLSGYTNTEQRASFAAQFDAKTGKQNWMNLYSGENYSSLAVDQKKKNEMEGGSDGAGYSVSYKTLNATYLKINPNL